VTPEQAEAEWESKKETHHMYFQRKDGNPWFSVFGNELPKDIEKYFSIDKNCKFELRPKALKQVSWGDIPVGVAVRCNDTDYVWILQGVGDNKEALITVPNNKSFGMRWIDCRDLTLAPASEQHWIAVQDCFNFPMVDGLIYEIDSGRFKITGIAKGYVLEGAV
jgi:hypothetical protein